ncbi:MAG: DUF4248 domain-containing protein [Tannerellaceae bacterium]|nr:DUF4248 domain-containing protein [Tannerellaceae bacterium]
MENKTLFRPRTYTWQELGLLYSPDHTPYAASKRLRRWVTLHPSLREELTHIGWKKGSHVLTPPSR